MALQKDPCHSWDKLGLFLIAGLVIAVLGGIVLGTYWRIAVPKNGDVLIGGIATGLILFLRDLVAAVRASWEEVTRGETMKTLGNSAPTEAKPVPEDAAAAANQVADAADAEAQAIGER